MMPLRAPWLLRGLVFATMAIACLETVWLIGGGPALLPTTLLPSTLLFFMVYPLSSLTMLWVATLHRTAGQVLAARGWYCLSVISLLMLCGDFSLYWLESRERVLFPSGASIFYFAIFPWFFLAYRNFTGRAATTLLMWQRRLDVSICVLAIAVYLWQFVFSPIAVTYTPNPGVFVLIVLSVVVLLIPLSIVAITLWNEEPLAGVHSLSFMVALLGYAAFVSLFFVQYHRGIFSTSNAAASMSLWILSLFCVSAVLGLERGSRPAFAPHFSRGFVRLRRVLPYLPYLAMAACFALLFNPRTAQDVVENGLTKARVVEGIGVLFGSMTVTLLVVMRQVLTMRENHRLTRELQAFSRELEKRVEERTKQLEDSHARLAANERLASLGRISAGLAHEINTPVAAAMNSLKQAQHLAEEYETSVDNPDVTKTDHLEIARELRHSLKTTDMSLDRLGEFVRRMRGQVRNSAGKNDFEAVRVVKDSLAMLEHRARKAKVNLAFTEPAPFYFYGDAARFSQVVSNLVVNALDACEENWQETSEVILSLERNPEGLWLEVTDNGVGIPKNIQEKIFEPLFTTKEVGKGTGLGLAIIQDIVYGDFDGRIELESDTARGTTFRVLLPDKKRRDETQNPEVSV